MLKKFRKSVVLRFRVTPAEKAIIEANAAASGILVSDYLRIIGLRGYRISIEDLAERIVVESVSIKEIIAPATPSVPAAGSEPKNNKGVK